MPPARVSYDVFLSYRQRDPDGGWVRGVLVPALKTRGLKVFVDYECFRLGRPIVTEMARGVEESRYTLAVLSPEYLEGNFTGLESILAEHLGLESSHDRLLAVMRWPCTPRLGFRARLWLDMTDEARFEGDVARLADALRMEPDAAAG